MLLCYFCSVLSFPDCTQTIQPGVKITPTEQESSSYICIAEFKKRKKKCSIVYQGLFFSNIVNVLSKNKPRQNNKVAQYKNDVYPDIIYCIISQKTVVLQ